MCTFVPLEQQITRVNREKQSNLTSHFGLALLYIIPRPPPGLKSIFIFAVLTFSSSSQRHNDWLPAAAATCLHTVRADTTRREERSYCSPAAPPLFLPKKIVVAVFFCSFFSERNRGTNARDRRGLNLQAKCVVTERNAEPSI